MLLLWFENRNTTEWSAFFAYNGLVVPFCVQCTKVSFLLYTMHMWNIQFALFAMKIIFLSKKKSWKSPKQIWNRVTPPKINHPKVNESKIFSNIECMNEFKLFFWNVSKLMINQKKKIFFRKCNLPQIKMESIMGIVIYTKQQWFKKT